jgi:hypothetical protein
MRRLCRPLETDFIEFNHGLRRVVFSESRGLQHFVVEKYRKLTLVQVRAEQNVEAGAADDSLCRRLPAQGVNQRSSREADFCEGKPAVQLQILEGAKVEHAPTVTGRGNSGKVICGRRTCTSFLELGL